jgi:hypothetical protein
VAARPVLLGAAGATGNQPFKMAAKSVFPSFRRNMVASSSKIVAAVPHDMIRPLDSFNDPDCSLGDLVRLAFLYRRASKAHRGING